MEWGSLVILPEILSLSWQVRVKSSKWVFLWCFKVVVLDELIEIITLPINSLFYISQFSDKLIDGLFVRVLKTCFTALRPIIEIKLMSKRIARCLKLTLVQLFEVYHKLWQVFGFQSVAFTNLHQDEVGLYPIWVSTLQSFHYLCQRSFEG